MNIGSMLKTFGGGVLDYLFRAINSLASGAMSIVSTAFEGVLQYHQKGIEFARSMGMSLKQAQAYTTVLTQRASDLGFKYGVAAEAVQELQVNLSQATGKALMLNDADAERMLQINKLVGAQTATQFQSEIIKHLGGQISTVTGAVSKAYATAAKSGLNAAQFSETVARNLTLANKLSFRDGINGIIRMTALSEKLGFNMQSIESAASKFLDIDKAIENAAQLQMLGGAAGAYGANPLLMGYEANYNPEAFMERMTNMLGGYAIFDAKTGMSRINGMNMDFVRNISQALGISTEEGVSIAKKQAEVQYKRAQFLPQLRAQNLSKEQEDYILNTSYIDPNTKRLMMTDLNGKSKEVGAFTPQELQELMSFEGKSDEELMKTQAIQLTSINEQLIGLQTSVVASLAKDSVKHTANIQNLIREFGGQILTKAQEIGPVLSEKIDSLIKAIESFANPITTAINFVGDLLKQIIKHIEYIIPLLLYQMYKRSPLSRRVGNLAKKTRTPRNTPTNSSGNQATTQRKNNPSNFKALRSYGKYVKQNYQTLRKQGNGVIKSAYRAIKTPKVWSNNTIANGATGKIMGNMTSPKPPSVSARLIRQGGKVARSLGRSGAIGILGTIGNIATDNLINNDKITKGGLAHTSMRTLSTAAEYGSLGAMIGSFIPGIGTAIGASIGGLAGAVKGYYDSYQDWKSDTKNANKSFTDYVGMQIKSAGNWFANQGRSASQWIERNGLKIASMFTSPAAAMTRVSSYVKDTWNNAVNGIKGFFNQINPFKKSTAKQKFASGGIVDGNSYTGDRLLTRVNSGEMILNKEQQSKLFRLINNGYSPELYTSLNTKNEVRSKPVGEKEYIYVPPKVTSTPSLSEVKVKDINLNISGTIRIDGGTSSKKIETSQLLEDTQFISKLKDIIKQSINNDINGGRFMNDVAQLRGLPAQTTIWGRK